jgi:hypothetical protein
MLYYQRPIVDSNGDGHGANYLPSLMLLVGKQVPQGIQYNTTVK